MKSIANEATVSEKTTEYREFVVNKKYRVQNVLSRSPLCFLEGEEKKKIYIYIRTVHNNVHSVKWRYTVLIMMLLCWFRYAISSSVFLRTSVYVRIYAILFSSSYSLYSIFQSTHCPTCVPVYSIQCSHSVTTQFSRNKWKSFLTSNLLLFAFFVFIEQREYVAYDNHRRDRY